MTEAYKKMRNMEAIAKQCCNNRENSEILSNLKIELNEEKKRWIE